MMITVMKSKLHHATVTHANVKYEGSITIDQDLMDLTDIVKGERVQVVDLNNGERLETYVIPGERGSGVIGLNGPAALKCRKGHIVHIISYAIVEKGELAGFREKVYLLGDRNAVVKSLLG